jgi:hypothetical protein
MPRSDRAVLEDAAPYGFSAFRIRGGTLCGEETASYREFEELARTRGEWRASRPGNAQREEGIRRW